MLLALSGAVERVEGERERESEADTVGKDEVGEKREDERVEMKMKIQFMKIGLLVLKMSLAQFAG